MVAYNFLPEFAEQVRSGSKSCTIRGHRKRHARPGEAVQLYCGQRTRNCEKLLDPDPICEGVYPITIDKDTVILDGCRLAFYEHTMLAQLDGFEDRDDFFQFFRKRMPFEGVLIKWIR